MKYALFMSYSEFADRVATVRPGSFSRTSVLNIDIYEPGMPNWRFADSGDLWREWSWGDIMCEAEGIIAAHAEGEEMDYAFDAGEFSGPARDKMMVKELTELAELYGYTFQDIWEGVVERANRD